MARRAVIIGGSMGGLFAAAFLQRIGWEAHVYERTADDLATRGAGLGTHDALLEGLRALGIDTGERLGVLVKDRISLARDGVVVARRTLPQVMTHWARIYEALRPLVDRAHFHAGRNFTGCRQAGDEVVARFDDGTEAAGDLLIAADGLRSSVRAQLLPQAQPRYAGYVGWRGTVAGIDLPKDYYFGLPGSEMMLTYPVPTGEWNYVWYRPTSERELADLCTDASGHCHGSAIAPPLIRPELAARLKRDAHELLAPQLAAIVERSQPFFQAIFDLESPRVVHGRAALLGDAAFVARPHVGMGVTKASLDARCLARSLELAGGDLDAALARYDRLRREFGGWCVRRSRAIGAYIERRESADAQFVLSEVGAVRADIPITV
jgi:2-polyprenyl-6-methoxyphenol hydroxylase-like FAD-dependent oxidoreductase